MERYTVCFWNFISIKNSYVKLVVETVVSTFILLFFEFIFKAFFRAKGDAIISSSIITFIVQFFYSLFAWIASIFVNIAEWILKYIFNVKLHEKKEVFTKIDLEHFIQQTKDHDTEDNVELNNEFFENVLSFLIVKIRECLIPRKEIEAVEINTPLENVKEYFIETKLIKLVVFEDNIDNIQGYIHQLDIFKNPETLTFNIITYSYGT